MSMAMTTVDDAPVAAEIENFSLLSYLFIFLIMKWVLPMDRVEACELILMKIS